MFTDVFKYFEQTLENLTTLKISTRTVDLTTLHHHGPRVFQVNIAGKSSWNSTRFPRCQSSKRMASSSPSRWPCWGIWCARRSWPTTGTRATRRNRPESTSTSNGSTWTLDSSAPCISSTRYRRQQCHKSEGEVIYKSRDGNVWLKIMFHVRVFHSNGLFLFFTYDFSSTLLFIRVILPELHQTTYQLLLYSSSIWSIFILSRMSSFLANETNAPITMILLLHLGGNSAFDQEAGRPSGSG